MTHKGSLVVVGTGIQLGGHLTLEAQAHITHAEKVLYVSGSKIMGDWIVSLNKTAESLAHFYAPDKPRAATYSDMADTIVAAVRGGQRVCAVFYGHPGVFVQPSHEAIQKARAEGFDAKMLPGISAEDCLFADLGFDPADHGCQSFEATDFLIRTRIFDPYSTLIIWQIETIGQLNQKTEVGRNGLHVLVEYLQKSYTATHPVTVYQAAELPVQQPFIHTCPLAHLADAPIPHVATLYVPPLHEKPLDPAMLTKLGLRTEKR